MSYLKLLVCACVVVSVSSMVLATPANFNGSYSENFSGLGTTGTVMPAGYSAYSFGLSSNDKNTYTAANPITSTAIAQGTLGSNQALVVWNPGNTNSKVQDQLINCGTIGNTSDRALGTNPTVDAGTVIQLALKNNTGVNISAVTIGYDMKDLADGASGNESTELPGYAFFYSLTGGTTAADWTSVPSLYLTSSVVSATPTHASATINCAFTSTSTIYLRWADDNNSPSSPDAMYAIDNVTVTPEPATMSLLVLGGLAMLRRSRKA